MKNNILPFSSPRVPAEKRIGPHNFDILSIIIGSLLGDASMERSGNGSRFVFYQAKSHGEYLLWLHQVISLLGYAKIELPLLTSRVGLSEGEIRYYYRFRTFTFSSFNWIHDAFYVNKVKVVPKIIEDYLTPLSLAVWAMDDGCLVKNRGFIFSTNSFTLEEVQFLSSLLDTKFNLNTSIHKAGKGNQFLIYIPKHKLPDFIGIVKQHIHPTMLYKINEN
jgi:hypothetical protein